MRILHLNLERGWRGGERQTLLCLRHQRDAGHDVALLARTGGALAEQARSLGLTVHTVAGTGGLVRWLCRHRRAHDILHAQTAQAMTWLALLRPLLAGRVVFTRRTAFQRAGHHPGDGPRAARTPAAWKWRRADGLAAISQAAAAALRDAGLHPVLIPSAVKPTPPDPARCAAVAAELNLTGRRVLGTAAALSPEKDPLTLIDAFHQLCQQRDDVVFVHFGADGAASDAARQRVETLGLQHRWRFAGFRAGVEALYPLMDVFVLSSREEALGSSVLDAFLAGVPVAASDAGGLPELLADGRGLLSPVGDAPALAHNLARLLDDETLRQRCTAAAHDYVLAEHDARTMAHRYLALYETLLSAATPRRY